MNLWYERKKNVTAIMLLMIFAFLLYRFDGVIDIFNKALIICRPFIFGGFLAILVSMPMRHIEKLFNSLFKKRKLEGALRALALSLSVLFVSAILSLILLIIIPEVSRAIDTIIKSLPSALTELITRFNAISEKVMANLNISTPLEGDIKKQVESVYRYLLGGIGSSTVFIKSATSVVFDVVIAFIFAIYLLYSNEKISANFKLVARAYIKKGRSESFIRVCSMLVKSFYSFISGQCIQALISASLIFIALSIFGLPYALLIALMVFVTSFIPLLGPYISGLLGAIMVYSFEPDMIWWFVIVFFVIQQLSGSVIFPRIMSEAINLPSIWVLISVTLGGGIMGIPGMIFFIPITSVVYTLVLEKAHKRVDGKCEKAEISDIDRENERDIEFNNEKHENMSENVEKTKKSYKKAGKGNGK